MKMPMKTVIVEDNVLIAADLEQALSDAGYEVIACLPSYRSALQWIASNPPPDACVLDLDLGGGRYGANAPGEEGRRLLALMTERSVPTVVYSAHSRSDAKLPGLDMGAAYVSKGQSADEVIRALGRIIAAASP